MVDSYRFGEVVVDGKVYTTDITISLDRSVTSWWRREGHVLNAEDLREILKEDLEVLVVGTGKSGLMSVPQETVALIGSLGVELFIEKTDAACKRYNSLLEKKKVAAALHLTC